MTIHRAGMSSAVKRSFETRSANRSVTHPANVIIPRSGFFDCRSRDVSGRRACGCQDRSQNIIGSCRNDTKAGIGSSGSPPFCPCRKDQRRGRLAMVAYDRLLPDPIQCGHNMSCLGLAGPIKRHLTRSPATGFSRIDRCCNAVQKDEHPCKCGSKSNFPRRATRDPR